MRDAVHPAVPVRHARGGLRHALRTLHLWLGLSVGILYALIALSGSVLALQTPLLRTLHPELAVPALPTPTEQAAVLARIAHDWSARGLRGADLPEADLPVWQLYFSDGARRYLDPASGSLLLTRTPANDGLLALRDWHTHLLAGDRGETVLGALGWISLLLLLCGLVLWWPKPGQLLAHLKLHTQPPVRRWRSWHRCLGTLGLPLLLLVTLTGTLMVYHDGTRHAVRALFGDPPEAPAPARIPPRIAPIDWPAVLAAARRALPGAQLSRVSLPSASDGRVTIRARAPGERHPVGRSMIVIDPYQARVLATVDATRAASGTQVNNLLYPLHAGDGLGPLWQVLVIVCGLLPAFFLVTGFLFWRVRTRRHG